MAQKNLEVTIKENFIKNLIVLVCCFLFYPNLQSSLHNISVDVMSNFLFIISILIVTVSFANFAFTYEKNNQRDTTTRLLAHLTTGLLMFIIGISLEMTSVITSVLIGDFQIFNISLIILYLASVLYDFWDLNRAEVK